LPALRHLGWSLVLACYLLIPPAPTLARYPLLWRLLASSYLAWVRPGLFYLRREWRWRRDLSLINAQIRAHNRLASQLWIAPHYLRQAELILAQTGRRYPWTAGAVAMPWPVNTTGLLRPTPGEVSSVFYVTSGDFGGGARGDGITDDTTALLACVSAANISGNAVIWVPYGTFLTAQALVVNTGNVWFDGPGTIKLKNSSNHALIRFASAVTGGGVRNIGLDGNKANNTGPGDGYGNQGVQVGHDGSVCTHVSVL